MGLQTDDTLLLADDTFADAEEDAIKYAKLMSKDRNHLTTNKPIKFNEALIELTSEGNLTLKQETQIAEISLVRNLMVSMTSAQGVICIELSFKEQYVAQRARRAYIASICQPEVSFDLSNAAQSTKFSSDNIAILNKRL